MCSKESSSSWSSAFRRATGNTTGLAVPPPSSTSELELTALSENSMERSCSRSSSSDSSPRCTGAHPLDATAATVAAAGDSATGNATADLLSATVSRTQQHNGHNHHPLIVPSKHHAAAVALAAAANGMTTDYEIDIIGSVAELLPSALTTPKPPISKSTTSNNNKEALLKDIPPQRSFLHSISSCSSVPDALDGSSSAAEGVAVAISEHEDEDVADLEQQQQLMKQVLLPQPCKAVWLSRHWSPLFEDGLAVLLFSVPRLSLLLCNDYKQQHSHILLVTNVT